MDTPAEYAATSRALTREALRGPEVCEHCGDWVMDHSHCHSCNAVVCTFGLCAGCTAKSKDACLTELPDLNSIVLRIAHGEITADEAGERLHPIAYRLSTWDVLPNPNTAAGIEDAEARASAAVPEGLRAA